MRIGLILTTGILVIPACIVAQPPPPPPASPSQVRMQSAQDIRERVVWCSHKEPPGWYTSPPDSDDRYDYFVGHSVRFVSEPAARDEAMNNAVRQFARFCGVEIKVLDEYLKVTTGKTSSVLVGELSQRQQEQQESKAFVSSIKPKEWYLRQVQTLHDGTPIDTGWMASVLIIVPLDEKDKVQAYARKKVVG